MFRLIKSFFIVFVIITVCGVLFIKLNTSAAANFTDNILRPLIGDKNVLFIEKVFFNISDQFDRLAYKIKQIEPPLFTGENVDVRSVKLSALDLTPVPVRNFSTPLKSEGQWKLLNLKSLPAPTPNPNPV